MERTVFLPAYSVSEKGFESIKEICPAYGSKAVIIGGKRALAAAESLIRKSCNAAIEITGTRWYGGQASYENVYSLSENEAVVSADMIFAVGGGKCIDTCKALGEISGKPVFTFPTIASTCAATTAVAIMYHPDGTFYKPFFLSAPPKHTFICGGLLAEAPSEYLWAGMGDTYAKYFESEMSSRGDKLMHDHALGVTVANMCLDPVLKFGRQALTDNKNGSFSEAFLQIVLAITVTTGIASIYLTKGNIIDYNTGLAHAIFYSLTKNPEVEENHLHGEVVSYGVLVLLAADGNDDMFRTVYDFNKSVGLPTKLSDIGVNACEAEAIAESAAAMHDIDHNPYKITAADIAKAIRKTENY